MPSSLSVVSQLVRLDKDPEDKTMEKVKLLTFMARSSGEPREKEWNSYSSLSSRSCYVCCCLWRRQETKSKTKWSSCKGQRFLSLLDKKTKLQIRYYSWNAVNLRTAQETTEKNLVMWLPHFLLGQPSGRLCGRHWWASVAGLEDQGQETLETPTWHRRYLLSLKRCVSMGQSPQVPPQKTFDNAGDFSLSQLEQGVSYWHLAGRSHRCYYISYHAQDCPHNKE